MDPRIFASHQTAQRFWRNHELCSTEPASRLRPSRQDIPTGERLSSVWAVLNEEPLSFEPPLTSALQSIGYSTEIATSVPIHCLVSHANRRRIIPGLRAHVWTSPLPADSFRSCSDRLIVSSPAFCFLQMASMLPFHELVEYGFELCSNFALKERLEESITDEGNTQVRLGFRSRTPLTSQGEISAYLEKQHHSHGLKLAKQAIRYCRDNAESPYEVKLVMVLCLPLHRGGFGLPFPTLNMEIELDEIGRTMTSAHSIRPDLIWPKQKVVVEYDSDLHTGSRKIADDSIRRNVLIHMGYHVITVTRLQIKDANEMTRVARTLEQALRIRKRKTRFEPSIKRAELWRALQLRKFFGNKEAGADNSPSFSLPEK